MADIIATVWDFDQTLIPGYMQDPIFKRFNYDPAKFWRKNSEEIQVTRDSNLDVNEDSFYLNQLIDFSKKGQPFQGLNNKLLLELGKEIEFYPGAVELFEAINNLNEDETYREFGISFENYIVSTGLKKMITGSKIFPHVKHIWGAELADIEEDGINHLGKIVYSLDNTTKTRAIFEINKGVGIVKGASIDVNTKMAPEERRVQFCNMIYVADGPSDVPAFSVVNQKGGSTLAVYRKGDTKAFEQVVRLRREDRVQMIAEADYTKDSTAEMWLMQWLKDQASAIIDEKRKVFQRPAGTPKHIIG